MPSDFWKRGLEGLAELPKQVAWAEGMVLTGLNFKEKDKGYFLVVAAKRRNGERVVSFWYGRDMAEALSAFIEATNQKGGVRWYKDKYAK